ncbi:MAG: hypothetical protein PHZ11_07475 [Desulfitobacteriaceae bacterium]|nr:hypothetical protein [Desulfitobacteriaceae bacterium]MDD4346710.1 hypothetical protein [Desulfitobacteriaceae bacterium]MDD4402283.1 hypothetical protein [Desulfitobacteriaceae bacterium]
MKNTDYFGVVSNRFNKSEEFQIGSFDVKSYYEEQFKVKWLATKLKIFSFVAHVNEIDADDITNYSSSCVDYALNNYKGLPRGLQTGLVAFNVLISENVSDKAIEVAVSRPKKRFAAFEIPIIYDLSKEKAYYYTKTPMWGAIYYKYFREYIQKNFIA